MKKRYATDWATTRARVMRRTVKEPSGCWNWSGSLDIHGYARIAFLGTNWRVSRVSWCAFNETDWPDGKYALHSCDNRWCVNPAHIRPGTNAENIKEMWERGGRVRPTHCRQGHEYTPENTARNPSRPNSRRCRECARIKSLAATQRRKARAMETQP